MTLPTRPTTACVLTALTCLLAAGAVPAQALRPLAGVGFYVDGDPNSWSTVRTQGHRLNGVVTATFTLDADGRVSGRHDPRIVALARSRGARVYVRVAASAEAVRRILVRPVLTGQVAAAVVEVLREFNYDGAVLDLGALSAPDRPALRELVTALASAARSRGDQVFVVVPVGEDGTPPPAYDLAALGRTADALVVRAYHTGREAGPIGPVAPLPWVERAARAALSQVRASHLLLGVGLFGYDWPARGVGEVVSMREALGRAARAGVPVAWDERAQVPYYRILDRTVYFEDARSVERKLEAAAHLGLAGVALWQLGSESPDLWAVAGAWIRPHVAVSSAR
jgi:spore germination protein YaaH